MKKQSYSFFHLVTLFILIFSQVPASSVSAAPSALEPSLVEQAEVEVVDVLSDASVAEQVSTSGSTDGLDAVLAALEAGSASEMGDV